MRTVTCANPDCENFDIDIEVADNGFKVICGGGVFDAESCNSVLAEATTVETDTPIPEGEE